ncbi:MAG: chorismate mutase [Pseudomonadota bacterium]
MTEKERTLADLRQNIDQIDGEMHQLIMRRSELVQEIAARKSSAGNFMRPGREAQVVRRLVAAHHGAFPKLVLVRIWREIISAFTGMQGPFSAAVFTASGHSDYEKLARAQFGSLVPLSLHASEQEVLSAIARGQSTLGILPLPQDQMEDPWWRHLGTGGRDLDLSEIRILARLPFAAAPAGEAVQALVVSRIEPEPSGLDNSFILLKVETADHHPDRDDLFAASDLSVLSHQSWQGSSGELCDLVEVAGFITDSDPRLIQLAQSIDGEKGWIGCIGAYAVPLAADDLSSS